MAFALPPLPYAYGALEPLIDTTTMMIHLNKHHNAYVSNLNKYINSEAGHIWRNRTLLDILSSVDTKDVNAIVRNNAGGHYNHWYYYHPSIWYIVEWQVVWCSLYWTLLSTPATTKTGPTGALADAIHDSFGSFNAMRTQFDEAAMGRFGSGWAWLGVKRDGSLAISSTPNQGKDFCHYYYSRQNKARETKW